MLCENCNKEIKDTAKFCGYCGSKIITEVQSVKEVVNKPAQSIPEPGARKPLLKPSIIISVIVGLLVITSIVVFFSLQPSKEEVLWNEVATINTIASYDNYLKAYPEGKYVKEILLRKENITWKKVQSKNDKASYKRYLEVYPNGRYNNEAIRKLKEIEKEEKQLQA